VLIVTPVIFFWLRMRELKKEEASGVSEEADAGAGYEMNRVAREPEPDGHPADRHEGLGAEEEEVTRG
jgi:hypothetical protein